MRNCKWMAHTFKAIGLAMLLVSAGVAHAGPVIFGFTGGTQHTNGGMVAGISFNTSSFSTPTIQSLGFFDFNDDGLIGSYQVGLFDSSQNLLASGTVTPASPLIGDFRWVGISPVTLAASSTYTVAALLPSGTNDVWLDNASLILGSGFGGAGTGQFKTSGSLVYPTNFDSTPYVITNASDVAVPEPGSLSMLVAAGALLMRRRQSR